MYLWWETSAVLICAQELVLGHLPTVMEPAALDEKLPLLPKMFYYLLWVRYDDAWHASSTSVHYSWLAHLEIYATLAIGRTRSYGSWI